jgi:hypothetical protein
MARIPPAAGRDYVRLPGIISVLWAHFPEARLDVVIPSKVEIQDGFLDARFHGHDSIVGYPVAYFGQSVDSHARNLQKTANFVTNSVTDVNRKKVVNLTIYDGFKF